MTHFPSTPTGFLLAGTFLGASQTPGTGAVLLLREKKSATSTQSRETTADGPAVLSTARGNKQSLLQKKPVVRGPQKLRDVENDRKFQGDQTSFDTTTATKKTINDKLLLDRLVAAGAIQNTAGLSAVEHQTREHEDDKTDPAKIAAFSSSPPSLLQKARKITKKETTSAGEAGHQTGELHQPSDLVDYCPTEKDWNFYRPQGHSFLPAQNGWGVGYRMFNDEPGADSFGIVSKFTIDVVGGYVEALQMDVSQVEDGINANFYTTSPEDIFRDPGEWEGKINACDSGGAQEPCMELDLVETTGGCGFCATWHDPDGKNGGPCDGGGWRCQNGWSLERKPFDVKMTIDNDGCGNYWKDGQVILDKKVMDCTGTKNIVQTRGILIRSTQWAGWTYMDQHPEWTPQCPGTKTGGGPASGTGFSVAGVRFRGKLVQGEEPTRCADLWAPATADAGGAGTGTNGAGGTAGLQQTSVTGTNNLGTTTGANGLLPGGQQIPNLQTGSGGGLPVPQYGDGAVAGETFMGSSTTLPQAQDDGSSCASAGDIANANRGPANVAPAMHCKHNYVLWKVVVGKVMYNYAAKNQHV
ncbi:unnamed protein product [Amoebophrya sp. A120]|nr:unnamed protein product [Amoebophrya sp. A120]|eukprot:GSA120T00012080001.1